MKKPQQNQSLFDSNSKILVTMKKLHPQNPLKCHNVTSVSWGLKVDAHKSSTFDSVIIPSSLVGISGSPCYLLEVKFLNVFRIKHTRQCEQFGMLKAQKAEETCSSVPSFIRPQRRSRTQQPGYIFIYLSFIDLKARKLDRQTSRHRHLGHTKSVQHYQQ